MKRNFTQGRRENEKELGEERGVAGVQELEAEGGRFGFHGLFYPISSRKTRRFTTSSSRVSFFGVSKTMGRELNSVERMISRKGAQPILPFPTCSWRSTRDPKAVLES